ncbi:MAG: molecular chaperone DnaK [Gammaproteobacteria bacterium]|nr:MAG: molecular chaperone DnaK [Gammaproteobacteria bacterium]
MSTIAGIDLGTTFSALARLNGIGRPEIVPNSEGERITPSAVYFEEDQDGAIRVGLEAVNCRQLNPERAVRWIKRHMGDQDWKKDIDGRDWTPQEISSLILKKIKQDGSIESAINDVVISVPAHFDEARRKATMDAGTLAGLNVIGIVNEPVAAALYYATTQAVKGRVLVYDLGGGTFDVTILDIDGQQMDIICSQGDHALGGVDFDKKIVELFEDAYRQEHNAELIENEQDRAKYEDEAEDVKKTLSRRDSVRKILYGSAGSARIEITREQYEKAIEPLIARTEILIEVAMEEAKSTVSDIEKVLLVGGSTRMPMVHQQLKEKFGFEPEVAVNVDECVALGAAIHAGLTRMRENPKKVTAGIAAGLKEVQLKDVCNHSYGTICAPVDAETGQHVIRNSIILQKNTPLPCEATQTFYTMSDGQTELQVTITQGEDEDPDFVNKIATEVFELPANRPANQPIHVQYSYDANQRMHCRFLDEGSGRTLEVEFCAGQGGQMTQTEIQQAAEELDAIKVQ